MLLPSPWDSDQFSWRTNSAVWHRFQQAIKNDLIAGFLVVIPLATTIWLTFTIARSVINWLTRIPKQLNPFTAWHPLILESVNLLVGLAVPLLGILLIGLMARNFVGKWLLETGEGILTKIPLAGTVYRVLQQILETFLRDSRNRFRRVVLVEYPRPGLWAVGFVTGTIAGALAQSFSQPMLSIFIPTSPNPTTGWYAITPEQDVIDLEVSVEDAFKLIISGGIVTPNSNLTPSKSTALSPNPVSLTTT